jgi:hypothetical protein
MSTQFSIEEKVYQKLLLLQANDKFMADVLALRKKANEYELIEEENGNSFAVFYGERSEFDADIVTLRKKYDLPNIYQVSLSYFVFHNSLIKFHNYLNGTHVKAKLIPEIIGSPTTITEYDEETGHEEDVVHYPDNWDAEQYVAIELFPETTINDITNNWERIAKERDRLYGIKRERDERFARRDNLERDLEILKLKKAGKTYKQIASIMNGQRKKGAKLIGYEDIPKIVERLKKRANNLMASKES